ncbi:DinB family protein [Deinococcus maricopensis]|uniref:DinB family protein n=1 Tax=Deinococcus maricopensis (strain DSM 21211 / LMG 22137 / NRRL B-23946 / LB-34) TaxID=709986 RepID=E8UBC4_DEIML|nr:DinB family protein [Deinococcus maricopensis]ADV68363.1 DinB family protein [Deinococcus maricopensis DSM 21211]
MHPDLSSALAGAVHANIATNDAVCAALTPAMMDAVTPGGGYTVAQHLAHMAASTKHWLAELDDAAGAPLPDLYDLAPDGTPVVHTDPVRAGVVLRETWQATLDAVTRAPDRGALPHPSATQFLMHMLVHDAHHRGQLLLALKAAGHPLPDDAAMWRDSWRGGA